MKILHHEEEEASLFLHETNLNELHGYTQRDVISVIPININSVTTIVAYYQAICTDSFDLLVIYVQALGVNTRPCEYDLD